MIAEDGGVRMLTASDPASYEWVFELLVGRTATATWANAGELPVGFERAEQFAVLPAGAGRSFMVSTSERSGIFSALTSYNALRSPRRQLERGLMAAWLGTRLAGPLLGGRIDVGTVPAAGPEPSAEPPLSDFLREYFGRGRVVIAFGGGSGPYRKPVLQVFGADGTPFGYVKVGWNAWTRDAVRREAAALRACAAGQTRLGAPALLDQVQWRGLDLLITAPLPAGVRRLGRRVRPDAALLTEISELWPRELAQLAGSGWWLGLKSRIQAGVADAQARRTLDTLTRRVERSHGHQILQFGGWHGDLVPWNLARIGTRLFAWDWESSAPSAPLGFDAVHFYFQVAFVERQCPLDQAAALAVRQAAEALAALGVPAQAHGLLAVLHLLELFVRHEEARSSTGDADDRFYPAVAQALSSSVVSSVEVAEPGILDVAS
jgi:hypothetical protein